MRRKRVISICLLSLVACLWGCALETIDKELEYKESLVDSCGQEGRAFLSQFMNYDGSIVYLKGNKLCSVSGDVICENVPEDFMDFYNSEYSFFGCNSDIYEGYLYTAVYNDGAYLVKWKIGDSTAPERIPLPQWKGETFKNEGKIASFNNFSVDDRYVYLISVVGFSYNLQIFTYDGELIGEIEGVEDCQPDMKGSFFVAAQDKGLIHKYSADTMEISQSAKCDELAKCICFNPAENRLYVLTRNKLCFYSADELNVEEVTYARGDMMISCSDALIEDMATDADGSLYCLSESDNIYKYALGEKEPQGDYTLTLTMPYQDNFISQVIKLYEKENSGQRVKYDYEYNSFAAFVSSGKEEVNAYFDRANVELLSGEGGDIYMNSDDYPHLYDRLRSDLFVDLSDYIERDGVLEELDSVALEAVKVNGQLKALPVVSDYYYIEINEGLAEEMNIEADWENMTWGEAFRLADRFEGTEYALFAGVMPENLLSRYIASNLTNLIDYENKTIDLEQDWFLSDMEFLKGHWNSKNFFRRTQNTSGSPNALIWIGGKTEEKYLCDIMSTLVGRADEDGYIGHIYPRFCGQKDANRVVGSKYMFSITESSENKEEAWNFIRCLISYEAMIRPTRPDFPLNMQAREKYYDDAVIQLAYQDKNARRKVGTELERVTQLVDNLVNMTDAEEILYNNLCEAMNDKVSLKQALEESRQYLWLLMNE